MSETLNIHDEDGYSWLGRRPRLAVIVLIPVFPLFVLLGAVKGAWEGFDAWRSDARDVLRRLR